MSEKTNLIVMAAMTAAGLGFVGFANDLWRPSGSAMAGFDLTSIFVGDGQMDNHAQGDFPDAGETASTAGEELPEAGATSAFLDIQQQAIERIGYVPQGGLPAATSGVQQGRTQRLDIAGVEFIDPATLQTEIGVLRLSGILPVGGDDECRGGFDTSFSCHDWALEGMHILIMNSSALRCLIGASDDEEATPSAMCQANIGGDWIDLASWAVRYGLNLAADDGHLASLQQEAQAAGRGIWSAGWVPAGAPRIDMSPSMMLVHELDDAPEQI